MDTKSGAESGEFCLLLRHPASNSSRQGIPGATNHNAPLQPHSSRKAAERLEAIVGRH